MKENSTLAWDLNICEIKIFERKWDIRNDIDTNAFFIAISKSNFIFTELYSARNVNTIYFDDIDYSSISENLSGVRFKQKYRLRWYGNFEMIKIEVEWVKVEDDLEQEDLGTWRI